MRAWLALALALSPAACLRSTSFKCSTSDQCGTNGTCEAVGYCSFPDPTCGQRFGDSAGDLANQCVTASPIDAGLHPDGIVQPDAHVDAPATTCPGGYTQIGSYAGHRYQLLTAQSWDAAKSACAGPNTFLAIPTEAAAVTALDSLVTTGSYWIGISESSGNFTTVQNAMATYLPWAPGQPNSGGGASCVEIAAAGPKTGLFDLQVCTMPHPAMCECDP